METAISLLIALGAGGILKTLLDGIISWRKGRQSEEHTAWSERDKEARSRRKLEEVLHQTRKAAIEAGVKDLPDWPEY